MDRGRVRPRGSSPRTTHHTHRHHTPHTPTTHTCSTVHKSTNERAHTVLAPCVRRLRQMRGQIRSSALAVFLGDMHFEKDRSWFQTHQDKFLWPTTRVDYNEQGACCRLSTPHNCTLGLGICGRARGSFRIGAILLSSLGNVTADARGATFSSFTPSSPGKLVLTEEHPTSAALAPGNVLPPNPTTLKWKSEVGMCAGRP